jgi:hypothetical protein
MFTNTSRIIPAAPAEKTGSQELQNYQSLRSRGDTSRTDTSRTGTSAQARTGPHSNSANETDWQDSSDYILQLLTPSVKSPGLHQDFTQPNRCKAAISKPSKPSLSPAYSGSLLDWASNWIGRWWGALVSETNINSPENITTGNRINANGAISSAQCARTQINQHGLGLLRQFEPLPSYSEQTLREIEDAVRRQVKVPLTSNQFSALVSLTYSLGEANLRRSTLLKYLNAGHYLAAASEFERWVYVGPNRLPELVARRAAERKLFVQNH